MWMRRKGCPCCPFSFAVAAVSECRPDGRCASPGRRIAVARPSERPHPAAVGRCRSAFVLPVERNGNGTE